MAEALVPPAGCCFFPLMLRLVPRSLLVLTAASAVVLPLACESFSLGDGCGAKVCAAGGSAGGRVASGGVANAGDAGADGGYAGGLAGSPGPVAGAPSGGTSGDGGAPTVLPELVTVRVGGREVAQAGTTRGIRSDSVLAFEFNVPMAKFETQAAYSADPGPLGRDDVTYHWDDTGRTLEVRPNAPIPYPEVADESEDPPLFHFSLSGTATSADGIPWDGDFSAAVSPLRRLTKRMRVDTQRSTGGLAYDATSAVAGFMSSNLCPVGQDYPIDLDEEGFPTAASGIESVIATGPDGTVGIYSYPLALDAVLVELEEARLLVGRWPGPYWAFCVATPGCEEDLVQFAVSVDMLRVGPLNVSRAREEAWVAGLDTADGASITRGFGLFEYDVRAELEAAFGEQTGAAIRLQFEEGPSTSTYVDMCAATLLDVRALIE